MPYGRIVELAARFFSEHPLMRGLDVRVLQRLARSAAPVTLHAGELLAFAGDPCEAVYFVVQGRLRAFLSSPQGREQVVSELTAGDLFYLVAALDDQPLPVSTQAATRATLLRLPRADFVALLREQPDLAMRVMRDLCQRLRQLTTLVEGLSLFSVPQRLARLLVERATTPDAERLTQREMAARLGTVREVVARALSQFAERGWLRLGRGSIAIEDLQALRDLAQDGSL